uniref:Gnk2-homologous domain-containing protein n=1 Tax=Triticum aestivum TaxID=4565 RepID=A0A080YU94_WHEAT|nr:unnamed protein product [Triticum aestivum]
MIQALLLLALIPLAAAQAWPNCFAGHGNYSAGSTYENNLLDLLLARPIRLRASDCYDCVTSAGQDPATAWALALYRVDVSASDCYDCVTSPGQDAATACNRSRDVGLSYDQCYVRLANHNDFLDPNGNSGEVNHFSDLKITSNDVDGYNRAVTGLLSATVQYAVENSTRLFATGQWVGPDPGFSNIYSAAQCAADLSPMQCRSCLQGLVGKWWSTFSRDVMAARLAGPRCTLRSELDQFYNGDAMLLLPTKVAAPAPPAPAPTAATRGQLAWLPTPARV